MRNNNTIIKQITRNEFETEFKNRLYRTVKEIIHPTISKKNISNYIIIVDENLCPLRIFYPHKITKLNQAIVFIHGNSYLTNSNENYSEICKNLAQNTNSLVVALDYKLEEKLNHEYLITNIYNTIDYITKELNKEKITNITLMGDNLGANIILSINELYQPETKKQLLIGPITSWDYNKKSKYIDMSELTDEITLKHLQELKKYYYKKINYVQTLKTIKKQPKSLIITGNADIIKKDGEELHKILQKGSNYININFAGNDILASKDHETKEELIKYIIEFINK